MLTVHIVQTYDNVRDTLAEVFKIGGFDVKTHDVTDLAGIQTAFAQQKGPIAVVTSQFDSRSSFPGNPRVGNQVAMAAKMTDVPTLTLVYSSVAPMYDDHLNDTDKDKVVLVDKSSMNVDAPALLRQVAAFFMKNKPQ